MNNVMPSIVCYGEVLWDLLPTGKVLGGAPMNVAYHASQLGLSAQVISSIGDDVLGRDLRSCLTDMRLDSTLIQIHETYPTGTVHVTLDTHGSPTYQIVTPAAWDHIMIDTQNSASVQQADAFVFGSLSSRHDTSRTTLLDLLEVASLKVLDVNLRSPFYTQSLLMDLLDKADIVKMNSEELQIIGAWLGINGSKDQIASTMIKRYSWKQLIITRGSDGAWLYHNDAKIVNTGINVTVRDTIGSGDAFLAAYLSQYLISQPLESCLDVACSAGAYVASQRGATPEISHDYLSRIVKD